MQEIPPLWKDFVEQDFYWETLRNVRRMQTKPLMENWFKPDTWVGKPDICNSINSINAAENGRSIKGNPPNFNEWIRKFHRTHAGTFRAKLVC